MINLSLVLKRARREWRQLGVLIVAVCLVTGFLALGPLYVRAMTQSGLQYAISSLSSTDLNLTFVSPTPYRNESWSFVNQQLGDLNAGLIRISRSSSAFGGFQFQYDEVTTELSPRSPYGYRAFAFSNLKDLVKLTDGRWPQRLAPPNSPDRTAANDAEAIAKGLGIYSRGEVEAVITPTVAKKARMEVGTRFVVGTRPENHVTINVVGIVEPINPNDPIWQSNGEAINGEVLDQSTGRGGVQGGNEGFNVGFIVTEGAYTDWISNATKLRNGENNSYVWQIGLNSGAINADNIGDVQSRMSYLINKMNIDYPGLFNLNPLLKVLNAYTDRISNTEAPVTLLSGAILVLMLYHLVTTVSLVLEQQMGEWSSLSSRGASTLQLVLLQGITMVLLGLIGFAVGPLIAMLILEVLTRVGPLAASTGGTMPISGIPTSSIQLSAIAAAASIIALTLPAFPAARRSLAEFKQLTARPPMRPRWARYWLDLILILIGLGFVARLLFFISGDLGQTLSLLASNPRKVIQAILDSANQTGGLGDPLNLIGPALLLTGVALLWLRLFPLLMGLLGKLFGRQNGLTGPLAIWDVERDPGHYAQLVLLLIGTLALGTAALALGFTRDQGAWSAAQQDVGGAVRLDLNTKTAAPVNWSSLPGVSGATILTRSETKYQVGLDQVFMVGVNADEMAKVFPATSDAVAPLRGERVDLLTGLPVPADITRLQIGVLAPDDARSQTPQKLTLALVLRDKLGNASSVTLNGNWTATPNTWVTFTGVVPPLATDRGSWDIAEMQFTPYSPELPSITGALFFDALQAVDANGKTTMLQDFENPLYGLFRNGQNIFDMGLQSNTAVSGHSSLRVFYAAARIAPDPQESSSDRDIQQAQDSAFQTLSLTSELPSLLPVPVVMSERMAEDEGRALRDDRLPLEVGMQGKVEIDLPSGKTDLNYKIVGIVRNFPSLAENQHFLLMDPLTLAQLVNKANQAPANLEPNQVWLELPARQPSQELIDTLKSTPGIAGKAFAWDRYNELLREPLPAAIAGMLYAGFWVSLLLSLLDFAFYLAVTARRRSLGFAVLRALGWNVNNIWALLVAEQAALVIPALLVGLALGAALAYVILPFLALVGGETLRLPVPYLIGLLLILLVGFGLLSFGAAWWLRRLKVNQVLRLGEE